MMQLELNHPEVLELATDGGFTVVELSNTLQGEQSNGNLKFWTGAVVKKDGAYFTRTIDYKETSDGLSSPVVRTPKRVRGKNVGRSNETTAREQALFNLGSMTRKKLRKRYWALGEDKPRLPPLPMLAESYDGRSHHITYPAYVQPKLDGHRMLLDTDGARSREDEPYIDEVVAHLMNEAPKGFYLDGEAMGPGMSFQETTRLIKKYRGDGAPKLQHHVYDVICPDLETPFSLDTGTEETKGRLEHLKDFAWRGGWLIQEFEDDGNAITEKFSGGENPHFVLVGTVLVENEEQMRRYEEFFVSLGYEGLMVRNALGLYTPGHRSNDLQKVKQFVDAEFTVVSFEDGEGSDAGTIKYLCQIDGAPDLGHLSADEIRAMSSTERKRNGIFVCRPVGSVGARKKLYDKALGNPDTLCGRSLTVKYQDLTDDGLPRFPVGKAFRD